MNEKSENVLDTAETTLIYILDGNNVQNIKTSPEADRHIGNNVVLVPYCIDHRAHIAATTLQCPLIFGGVTEELHTLKRWISPDPEDLLSAVPDLIGERREQTCCDDTTV